MTTTDRSGRAELRVEVPGGRLGGWVSGEGDPVLMLHGGPGLGYEYLDQLAAEFGDGFRIASFQQRGLPPSTEQGPFTVAQAVADVISVLDALGWQRALIAGHSWGGHLALRFAAAHPERVVTVLAIEPLGIAGDGGAGGFVAELAARTPAADRARARQLDDAVAAGTGTPDDALESLRLLWPAYFADPVHAPPMEPFRLSTAANVGLLSDLPNGLDAVPAALAAAGTRCVFVVGAGSPLPWGQAAGASAEAVPGAVVHVIPGAGHFPWVEVPGSLRGPLRSLPQDRRA
jgi:pimeloyl-ACP methyl ester carboxylesterase